MAKAMTKSKIIAAVAEKAGISKKQTALVLETLAQMSYKEAKNGFTFPGVGKLVVRSYKARMGRNPQTGEAIKIPARKRLKFVVAKAAKDSVLLAPGRSRFYERSEGRGLVPRPSSFLGGHSRIE